MMEKKYYPGLDLLKFVMALTIVSLHFELFKEVPVLYDMIMPWKNVAVPVFFIVSSFLLFNKLLSSNERKEENKIIIYFLKRIGILYLFWFVVMIRATVYKWDWDLHFSFFEFVIQFFLSSTFTGSWFLAALSINIVLVWYIRRYTSERIVAIIAIMLYLYNNYAPLMPVPLDSIFCWYENLPTVTPQTSFPGTMLFVYAGLLLSHYKVSAKYASYKNVWLIAAFAVLYILSLNQYFYPIGRLLAAMVLFIACCNVKTTKSFVLLRQSSIFIFFIHFALLGRFHYGTVINFIFACVISFILAVIVIWLKGKRGFKWLKYSL